jgi:hypothetical protein
MFMIVGQVSSPEQATEIEFITKHFVVANRAKELARTLNHKSTEVNNHEE